MALQIWIQRRLRPSGLAAGAAALAAMTCGAAFAQCEPAEVARLTPSDGAAADQFGRSIAMSGRVAVAAAHQHDHLGRDSGSAYVFQLAPSGAWVEVEELTASDGVAGDLFGWAVGVSGATAIVGARRDDDRGSDSGSAYLFGRADSGEWNQLDKITASDGAVSDAFGSSVAIDDVTAIVGAPTHGDPSAGAAYVFRDMGGGDWEQIDKLIAGDAASGDYFGVSVAVSGDTAIVGAYLEEGAAGAAYLFRDNGAGDWIQIAKLTAPRRVPGADFGYSVAIDGAIAIVGSRFEDSGRGAAYIFSEVEPGSWMQTARITPTDGSSDQSFGWSVGVSGASAIIGSWRDDPNGEDSGSTVLLRRTDLGEWIQVARLSASDGAAGDSFGISVTISGDLAAVGAHGAGEFGAGYMFALNCGPALTVTGECPGQIAFEVSGATSGGRVAFVSAGGEGAIVIPPPNPCAGTPIGLDRTAQVRNVVRADSNGIARVVAGVPARACGRVFVQAIDIESCSPTGVEGL